MTPRFHGRRIVVTGAGAGIGLATARRLADEGAEVIGLDLRPPEEPVSRIDFRRIDVTNGAAVDATLAEIAGNGGIDGLAAFAGIECSGTLDQLDDAAWRRVIDVNLFGTINVARAALPALRAARAGAIVLCSSQLSLSGARNCIAYATSKGAINAFTRSLALDCAASGLRVNTLAPGAIRTAMMDRVFDTLRREEIEASRLRHPLGRFGEAEEVAALACFLLSEEAAFMTGTIVPVDGGWTAA